MPTLKEYLGLICVERDFVVKLSNENLKKYKPFFIPSLSKFGS